MTRASRNERMAYFDIVHEGVADEPLMSRLGYSRAYAIGSDVAFMEKLSGNVSHAILQGKNPGAFMRSLHAQAVSAFCFEDFEAMNKVLAAASEAGKPVLIPVSWLFISSPRLQVRAISRARRLVSVASEYKAKTILATLASKKSHLVSSVQMLNIGRFLGMSDEAAKRAMSAAGDVLD